MCHLSGLCLSLGVEACDVAVVLIALHTALYIFRGASGLYPYRRVAYAAFLLVPLLLTLPAYINRPAFVNAGYYCYLPSKPLWTRRALSWGPRYLIVGAICTMYVSIYFYAKGLIKGFGRRAAAGVGPLTPASAPALDSEPSSEPGPGPGLVGGARAGQPPPVPPTPPPVPPTPPIAYHGLIPPTPLHQSPCVDGPRTDYFSDQGPGPSRPSTGGRSSMASEQPPDTPLDSTTPLTRSTAWGLPAHDAAAAAAAAATCAPSTSAAAAAAALRAGGRDSESSAGDALDSSAMAKTRSKIRRQLRHLFIYPAVYIMVWLAPFVSHVVGGDRNRASVAIVAASLASLSVQGVADALVFCILEKPWRHPRRRGAPSSSPSSSRWLLWLLFGCAGPLAPEGLTAANVGRTREEMLVDSRIARRRRDEELAERRLQRPAADGGACREWWDVPLESVGDDACACCCAPDAVK